MKTVLITGATSGIGKATAEVLAQHTGAYQLILCGRRQEKLKSLQSAIEATGMPCHTLQFDVTDKEAIDSAIASLPDSFKAIDVLINNAGNAHGLAPFYSADIADIEAMIDGNVKGIIYVSRAIAPGMITRRSGQIINIGSVAGIQTYPNGTVYCGSKAAVHTITEGMRMDLFTFGIRVGAVNPGMVETDFSLVRFKGDADKASAVYQGLTPLSPTDIAEIIVFSISRPSHVNLASILAMPTCQASAYHVNRAV